MDDKGNLCIATDCASEDHPMRDASDGVYADITIPVEFEASAAEFENDDARAEIDDAEAVSEVLDREVAEKQAEDAENARIRGIVEAVLFSSDSPISAAKLADIVENTTAAKIRHHIDALNEKYENVRLTFRIEQIARGYQMMTLPEYHESIAKLNTHRRETRLSAAALETLSIIAYKQPVIRADVEAIRGVSSGEVISRLREMGLVRILGRAEIVGRPILYGTTKAFLDIFGLTDLDDLPPMEAMRIKTVVKQASKPEVEVEPVKPPPMPAPPVEQAVAVGT